MAHNNPSSWPDNGGLNENNNRQLRYWLPKGTDLRKAGPDDLLAIASLLNHQRRRSLHGQTPDHVYHQALVR